ncbi:MerR family transcriptional regulator [Kurthia gibsonii]|uniref:MerR family transcriptional regulator n=1 Tax=Kurthia gibsonii TaxID=33946 RepID=UPI003F24C1A9
MHDFSQHYSISNVEAITGIKKETLRKWEQRYDFLHPKRLDNGYRQYSQQQVEFLCLLQSQLQQGISLKKAIQFATEQAAQKQPIQSLVEPFLYQLLAYGEECDEEAFSITLHQAHQTLGLTIYLQQLIRPFLQEVGRRWVTKQWSEYQEKFVSTLIQNHLVEVKQQIPVPKNAPLVIGACLPHENHELPLHMLLLQILLKGYRIFLIGRSPAPGTIEDFVDKLHPTVVLLSATTLIPLEHPDHLYELDNFAKKRPKITFFLGGTGANQLIERKPLTTITITHTLEPIWNALKKTTS